MDREQAMRAVTAVVESYYDDVSRAFGLHPTTPNWEALTDAMWVSQALTSDETMRASFDELKNLGVRHWIKTLRNLHEGKQT